MANLLAWKCGTVTSLFKSLRPARQTSFRETRDAHDACQKREEVGEEDEEVGEEDGKEEDEEVEEEDEEVELKTKYENHEDAKGSTRIKLKSFPGTH